MRFCTALSPFLPFLPFFSEVVTAQSSIPYFIRNISVEIPLNKTALTHLRGLGITWDIAQANGVSLPFTFSTASSTVELMAGTADAAGGNIMDVLGYGYVSTAARFSLRASLPSGQYHFRVNSTVNTTISGTSIIQSLSARGGTFSWTIPSTVGCGPGLTPDPFVPITSASSSKFTSFFLDQPSAGENLNPSNFLNIAWSWRNAANAGAKLISQLSIQVLRNSDGTKIGDPINIADSNLWLASTTISTIKIGIPSNASYKLRITYLNQAQDGLVKPGQNVTYLSDEFNIVDTNVNCTARK